MIRSESITPLIVSAGEPSEPEETDPIFAYEKEGKNY